MAVESVEIVLNGVDNASPVVDKVSQKLVSSEEKYISKLKEQLIAQKLGAAAAEEFKLAEMGFSEATIKSAAALRQQIEAAKAANQQVEQLGHKVEKTSDALKNTSEASQKVSGVFSKVFGAVGLAELSGFSDQIGGLSGQVKELEEAGTKGGMAFKAMASAGMAFAAVAAGWKVGTMIADWIYQTEAWNKKIQEGLASAEKTLAIINKKSQERFKLQMDLANAAATEEQRVAELRMLQASKAEEIAAAEKELAKEQADLKKALANDIMGYGKEDNAVAETAVKLAKDRLEVLRQQSAEVGKAIRGPTDDEAELQRRIKAQEDNKKAIEDARKANTDAWAELSKQLADEQKARDEQAKKDQSYLDGLKARNIELMNGKRAADEFKASLAGVTEETIAAGRELAIQNELLEAQKQLADEQKKKDEERAKQMAMPVPQLQAVQSRLLTRASVNPQQDRAVKANEKTAELTAKIEQLQREQQALLSDIRSNTDNQLMVVGEP